MQTGPRITLELNLHQLLPINVANVGCAKFTTLVSEIWGNMHLHTTTTHIGKTA